MKPDLGGQGGLPAPSRVASGRQGRGPGLIAAIRLPALLVLLALGACAKTGEPQPPQALVPRPATDLAARQVASRIMLTLTMPVQNTNGTRVTTMDRVEVFRLAGDRQSREPLTGGTFLSRAEMIQSIRAPDLDRYLRDGELAIPDNTLTDPADYQQHGYLYAVLFINRKNQTAGLSNQAFIAPITIPAAPDGLLHTVLPDAIRLVWATPATNEDGSVPARIAGYNVYRSEDPKVWPAQPVNSSPLPVAEFMDSDFEFDRTYFYAVSVVGSRENPYAESLKSAPRRVEAADTFAPGMPRNLDAVAETGIVTLLWGPPDETDVAGYRVYRRELASSSRILLQERLVTVLSFRDERVRPGVEYEYSVAAVDTHDNEGQAATRRVEVK